MGTGEERLQRARFALVRAEQAAGVRSAAERAVERDDPAGSPGRGVLEVGAGSGSFLRAVRSLAPPRAWIGFVGLPDIGWAAAERAGIDLARAVSVPDPAGRAAEILGLATEGFDVVCVGPLRIAPAQQRAIAARARRRGCLVLTASAWPGLSVRWTGSAPDAGGRLRVIV